MSGTVWMFSDQIDDNAKKQTLSRYGVTYILKKYAAKASPKLEPQNISPHVLRHTKAMHLLRAGVNMIGHGVRRK